MPIKYIENVSLNSFTTGIELSIIKLAMSTGDPVAVLNIFDNSYYLDFKSGLNDGDATEIMSTTPYLSGVTFENLVTASNINKDNAYIYGSPYTKELLVRGEIPKNNAFKYRTLNTYRRIAAILVVGLILSVASYTIYSLSSKGIITPSSK